MDIPVKVLTLLEEQITGSPVILLLDEKNNKVLPIWIGEKEAEAIIFALNGLSSPRPLTHQLFSSVLNQTSVAIERVIITKVEKGTFFAEICLVSNKKRIIVDARPSDSIALALYNKAPIFVDEEIMKRLGQPNLFTRDNRVPGRKIINSKNLNLDALKRVLDEARKREELM